MQFTTLALAALSAALPAAYAANAEIHNHCTFPVYLWSVTADGSSPQMIIAPNTHYSEPYRVPSTGGVSLKLSLDSNCADPITQFEYTLTNQIYYDISNINCQTSQGGCPFVPYGMHMASGPGCPTRTCPVGQSPCVGAYTVPDDNQNTVACEASQDVVLHLCHINVPGITKREDANDSQSPAIAAGRSFRRHLLHLHSHAHSHQRF